MDTLAQRLAIIHARIIQAEQLAARPLGKVQLIAVSKTKPAATIARAYWAGQRHFGENYVQEALAKQAQLSAFNITWHFIGPIQANKTKALAQHFHWIHSVDRLKIAQRLSEQRPSDLPPLQICVQVNISEESSKSGIMLAELPELLAEIQALPRLTLRGVMAIPAPSATLIEQRKPFNALYQAVKHLAQPQLDSFSMGMSDDLEAAILEGATWVRVGSAIFGSREH